MSEHEGPAISIIVSCYNYGRYLKEALTSIFNQRGKHSFEIIIVDDGSTDDTQEVLRSFTDPRIRVVTHPTNLGIVAVVNAGVTLARGQFIGRLDADDRYRPNFFSSALEIFKAHPEVGLVYGDVVTMNESGEVTSKACDTVHGGSRFKGNEFISLLERNFINPSALLARRDAWHWAVPIPGAVVHEDWYCHLMMARRFEFCYLNRVVADYRVHPENRHVRYSSDRSREPSDFWVLDKIFSEREENPALEKKKQRVRRRAHAARYLEHAENYFFLKMNPDARRCYLRALRFRPSLLLRAGFLRRFMATLVGRSPYERIKRMLKPLSKLRAGR